MKNLKLIFAVFATLVLAACQGSSSTPTPVNSNTCNYNYNNPYNTNGQAVPNCVSPYGSQYGNQYGYNNQYGANNSNPCAVYQSQYGVYYYPAMVGGQMMCVTNQ